LPPGRGIVDDHRPYPRRDRPPLLGAVATGREERIIDPAEHLLRRDGDLVRVPLPLHDLAGTALRGEQHQPLHRDLALRQDLEHRAADRAGRTQQRDIHYWISRSGSGAALALPSPQLAVRMSRGTPEESTTPSKSGGGSSRQIYARCDTYALYGKGGVDGAPGA